VVAATNVNIPDAIRNGKFREDLYYRLNTVPLHVPPLRERKEDIYLLFRKFASDFADRYKMPVVQLQPEAQRILIDYRWPGNVRQLKNVTEQLSILERNKEIIADTLLKYLPTDNYNTLPVLLKDDSQQGSNFSERELLYKVLFDMKKDLHDLKQVVGSIMQGEIQHNAPQLFEENNGREHAPNIIQTQPGVTIQQPAKTVKIDAHEEVAEESLSLQDKEKEMIQKAIEKYKGKRKYAARELGISERTLYRKLNEYNLS
jgi:DNA-binding NtrC family response regulator